MNEESYMIKKIFNNGGKLRHVLLTNGTSEIFESSKKEKMEEIVKVLNDNTDNGCEYEVITILNK